MKKIETLCEEVMNALNEKDKIQQEYDKKINDVTTYMKVLLQRIKELSEKKEGGEQK